MSRIDSAPITKQPNNYEIYNRFSVMGNEKCLHQWTYEKGTCGCSTIYYTTFTDTRLLIRTETTNCCYQRNEKDVSIFLRDIAGIRQLTDNSHCCACCCCHTTKIIELRGIFGSNMLYIPNVDMADLQIEIPAAIGNHKLISHR